MFDFFRTKKSKCKETDSLIECKVSPHIYLQCVTIMVVFAVAVVFLAIKFDRLWLISIPIVFCIGGGIYCLTCIKFTVLTFTQGKLIAKKGVISSSITEIPAVNILSITVDKGAKSRILDYGNITIKTANGEYKFNCMAGSDEFVARVSEYLVELTRKS